MATDASASRTTGTDFDEDARVQSGGSRLRPKMKPRLACSPRRQLSPSGALLQTFTGAEHGQGEFVWGCLLGNAREWRDCQDLPFVAVEYSPPVTDL
jgi:hypothetical protein